MPEYRIAKGLSEVNRLARDGWRVVQIIGDGEFTSEKFVRFLLVKEDA